MNETQQIIKNIEDIKGQMDSLNALLTKEQERLEAAKSAEPWKPARHEEYWWVDGSGVIRRTRNGEFNCDERLIVFGNCFPTELEAKRHTAKIKFMFRRCPEIAEGEVYWRLGFMHNPFRGAVSKYTNICSPLVNARSQWGEIFKTRKEAEEWLPLFEFAFLGGDCPEGF